MNHDVGDGPYFVETPFEGHFNGFLNNANKKKKTKRLLK